MRKLFEYGGKVSDKYFVVDVANIKAYDWFSSINIDLLTDDEKKLVNQLILNIGINDAKNSVTMNDARCRFIATKLMAKYDDLKEIAVEDYIILYQTMLSLYDKNYEGIDNVIRYINLLIGYTYSLKELTREEAIELRDLQNSIMSITQKLMKNNEPLWFVGLLPNFVVETLEKKFEVDDIINVEQEDLVEEEIVDVQEIKKVRKQKDVIDEVLISETPSPTSEEVPIEEVIDIKEQSKEVEPKDLEYKLTKDEEKKLRKYNSYITNLKRILEDTENKFSEKDRRDILEAIDTYEELANDLKKGQIYAVGGIVQSFSSPQIVDGMYSIISMFDNGGMSNDENKNEIRKFVFADGSAFVVSFDNDNGRSVNPQLVRVTQQEKITSVLLNERSLAEIAIDRMNEHNMSFKDGLLRLVKAKVFVAMYNGGGTFNLRVMNSRVGDNYPYYLWDANSGSIMSSFKTEQEALDYIDFLKSRANTITDVKSLSIDVLIQEKEEEKNELEFMINDLVDSISSFISDNETDDSRLYQLYDLKRDLEVQLKEVNKDLEHYYKIKDSVSQSEAYRTFRGDEKSVKQERIDNLQRELSELQEIISMLTNIIESKNDENKVTLNRTIGEFQNKEEVLKKKISELKGESFGGGGKTKFEKLSDKVAKNYEGKSVPKEYQKEYGKKYSEEEAKEVGDKVASKVYRQQLRAKKLASKGVKLKHSEVDDKNLPSKRMFADGGIGLSGYVNLSKEKGFVVNDSMKDEYGFPIHPLNDLPIIDIVQKNVIRKYPRVINNSQEVFTMMKNLYGDSIRTYESFYAIMLDKANKPIYVYEHSKGGMDSTIVDTNLVVAAANKTLAKGVILVHNHPSGSMKPSQPDITLTKNITNALNYFNVKVLDHIIISDNAYFSFMDEGMTLAKDGMKVNKNNDEEYLSYAEAQKRYHERAGTTSIKDKQKMAIDFVKENPEVLLLENGAKLNGVSNVEELAKRKLSGNFELPFEMAIYVPSTKNIDEIIGKDEFTSRIKEVETFVSKVFGGFSTDRVDGGFYSSDRKKLVREDVAKVYVFGSEDDFESKFNQLIKKLKQWGRAWSQESMGFEFEGDLYYVSSATKGKEDKMAYGGRMDINALKQMYNS